MIATNAAGLSIHKTLYGFFVQTIDPCEINPGDIPGDIVAALDAAEFNQCHCHKQIGGDKLHDLAINVANIVRGLYSYGERKSIDLNSLIDSIDSAFVNIVYVSTVPRKAKLASVFCTRVVSECFCGDSVELIAELARKAKLLNTFNKPQWLSLKVLESLNEGKIDLTSMYLCELKNIAEDKSLLAKSSSTFFRDTYFNLAIYNKEK